MGRKILNIATWAVAATLLLFAGALLLPRAAGLETYAVLTGSMQPAISAGSLVYTEKVQRQELAVGDVVIFQMASGTVVTHRIAAIDKGGNFTTKGDANNVPDMAPVAPSQVIGRVKFHLPVLGTVCEALKTRTGILAASGVLIVLILSVFLPEIAACDKKSGKKSE